MFQPVHSLMYECLLPNVKVHLDGYQEGTSETKIETGVDHDRCPARLKGSELHQPVVSRDLKQQSGSQQGEQHNRHKNWSPVLHLSLLP